jgi:hypothetical protein
VSAYDICAAVSFVLMAGLTSVLLGAAVLGGIGGYIEARRERIRDAEEYGDRGE